MDVTRAIQIAVAKVDLIVSGALELPWKRMTLSLLLAAALIHVVKAVKQNG